jgi:hypothetical protein
MRLARYFVAIAACIALAMFQGCQKRDGSAEDRNLVHSLLPTPEKFTSLDKCFEYVKSNSTFDEKVAAGGYACLAIFNGRPEPELKTEFAKLGRCVIENFSDIQDDASGIRTISICGKNSQVMGLARHMSTIFSPAVRIEKQRQRQLLEMEALARRNPPPITSPNPPLPQPFLFDDGSGSIRPCVAAGAMVHCD